MASMFKGSLQRIWYRRAIFTTGLIRSSYPASLRTQNLQGSPFNRKSLSAEQSFGAAISSTSV